MFRNSYHTLIISRYFNFMINYENVKQLNVKTKVIITIIREFIIIMCELNSKFINTRVIYYTRTE